MAVSHRVSVENMTGQARAIDLVVTHAQFVRLHRTKARCSLRVRYRRWGRCVTSQPITAPAAAAMTSTSQSW